MLHVTIYNTNEYRVLCKSFKVKKIRPSVRMGLQFLRDRCHHVVRYKSNEQRVLIL